ncbi:MAG: Formate--tetrahydrofolate ligase [Pseudomonadales bacterium]|nr:Formate--tetrahydrofolate ligase [Pseudomonadales bacterium]
MSIALPSHIAIARAARMLPVAEVAARVAVPADALIPYGRHKAKIDREFLASLQGRPDGRLVLVTAISPTPAGEGKTTVAIGLTDALARIGARTLLALREPSLGPCFGMKGGAAGGGYAQVVPMEEINLHFTGDFHAIGAAHNLLAAMIDNHLYWSNALRLDPRRVAWRRTVDMNDRGLRDICVGLGGATNGLVRESGYDITPASEVMAIFCLARDLHDLERRLANIVIGYRRDLSPVYARELNAAGAMTVLLREALQPNLVQTLENNPVLIHGGPFGNIAHGCNSLIATRSALKMADYVVTEAGFGADLGAEKFFDITARSGGLHPDAAVLVATVRALKMHGGQRRDDLGRENLEALRGGCVNLARHVRNIGMFGVPVVVAINRFDTDTDAEIALLADQCARLGCEAIETTHFRDGGAGAEALARAVRALADSGRSQFRPLYEDELPLWDKVCTVARQVYGAAQVVADQRIRDKFRQYDAIAGRFPVCIAKTQYSFSTDPALLGAPVDHTVTVRDVVLANGAGFAVALCGDIMTMPGLPRVPAAERIGLDVAGEIVGLS